MFCEECGSPLAEGDQFCANCGHSRAETVIQEAELQQTVALQPVPQEPAPQEPALSQTVQMQPTLSQPIPLEPAPQAYNAQAPQAYSGQSPQTDSSSAAPIIPPTNESHPQPKRRLKIVVAVLAVLVLLALAVTAGYFANAYFNADHGESTSANTANKAESDSSSGSADADSKSASKSSQGTKDDKSSCLSDFTYKFTSAKYVSQSGRFVVQGQLVNDDCTSVKSFNENVGITVMKNTDIMAAAYFRFKDHPIALRDGRSVNTVQLEFSPNQSFAPTDMDIAQEITLHFEANATPTGQSDMLASSEGYAGDDLLNNDQVQAASLAAMNAETNRWKSTVQQNIDNRITAQLSSKIEGLNAAGKTWTNADIWRDYLKYKQRFSNAMLLWGEDWPVYTKKGNNAHYYVVINGETYGSANDAKQWCADQGYSTEDCVPMDFSRKS